MSAQRPRLKLGRCIKELERLYGIEKGNNQYGYEKNSHPKITQEQLASQMDISVDTLNNYKKLTKLLEAMIHS